MFNFPTSGDMSVSFRFCFDEFGINYKSCTNHDPVRVHNGIQSMGDRKHRTVIELLSYLRLNEAISTAK